MGAFGRIAYAHTSCATNHGMNDLSDEAIVERVRGGEPDAFGLLMRRYQDRLYSVVLSYVHSPEDAVDLAQDAFVKAYLRLESYHGGSAFYTWLYRIAVNSAIDFLRKRPARQAESLDDDKYRDNAFEPAASDISASPERMIARSETKRIIQTAIDSLSEKLRTAIILHDVEGFSQEEIAEILQCPIGTIKSRVSRGRQELRETLSAYLEGGD